MSKNRNKHVTIVKPQLSSELKKSQIIPTRLDKDHLVKLKLRGLTLIENHSISTTEMNDTNAFRLYLLKATEHDLPISAGNFFRLGDCYIVEIDSNRTNDEEFKFLVDYFPSRSKNNSFTEVVIPEFIAKKFIEIAEITAGELEMFINISQTYPLKSCTETPNVSKLPPEEEKTISDHLTTCKKAFELLADSRINEFGELMYKNILCYEDLGNYDRAFPVDAETFKKIQKYFPSSKEGKTPQKRVVVKRNSNNHVSDDQQAILTYALDLSINGRMNKALLLVNTNNLIMEYQYICNISKDAIKLRTNAILYTEISNNLDIIIDLENPTRPSKQSESPTPPVLSEELLNLKRELINTLRDKAQLKDFHISEGFTKKSNTPYYAIRLHASNYRALQSYITEEKIECNPWGLHGNNIICIVPDAARKLLDLMKVKPLVIKDETPDKTAENENTTQSSSTSTTNTNSQNKAAEHNNQQAEEPQAVSVINNAPEVNTANNEALLLKEAKNTATKITNKNVFKNIIGHNPHLRPKLTENRKSYSYEIQISKSNYIKFKEAVTLTSEDFWIINNGPDMGLSKDAANLLSQGAGIKIKTEAKNGKEAAAQNKNQPKTNNNSANSGTPKQGSDVAGYKGKAETTNNNNNKKPKQQNPGNVYQDIDNALKPTDEQSSKPENLPSKRDDLTALKNAQKDADAQQKPAEAGPEKAQTQEQEANPHLSNEPTTYWLNTVLLPKKHHTKGKNTIAKILAENPELPGEKKAEDNSKGMFL
jgi:hypothetical protein